jgi:hypothetical protein
MTGIRGTTITNLLAYGGGVNSTALVVLLVEKFEWRGHIAFCDTGAEHPETYDFIFGPFSEWLSERGLSIDVIGPEFRLGKYRLSLLQLMDEHGMIPSVRQRWCTTEYKIAPFQRWCRHMGLDPNSAMVGIALDESHRRRDKIRPLVDLRITRDDCARIIRSASLPVPPKSGCVCCPFQSRGQWRALKEFHPEIFDFLVRIESKTRLKFDPDGEQSLTQIVDNHGQGQLFDLAEFYRPCMCRD